MNDLLKIVLIEDNQSDVELIRHELEKARLNFELTVVRTREGFEKTLCDPLPDIVLSDYSLPAFDGLSAFNIKQSKFPDIPFIMVSGTLGEELAVEMIKNGVTDYTLKDKMFTLVPKIIRGLKEANEIKLKRVTDEQLKMQYNHLVEIAFLQSHQVRVPVAQILGLFNLFNFQDISDHLNVEVFHRLKVVAESFDEIIQKIVVKTNEIEVTGDVVGFNPGKVYQKELSTRI